MGAAGHSQADAWRCDGRELPARRDVDRVHAVLEHAEQAVIEYVRKLLACSARFARCRASVVIEYVRKRHARLDHDSSLERELRRALDELTAARDEACDIADTAIKMRSDFIGRRDKLGSTRVAELRKIGA